MTPSFHVLVAAFSRLVTTALLLAAASSAVRPEDLYEFGDAVGDFRLLKGDDIVAAVTLDSPVNLFGERFDKIYVSTNGLVSFLSPLDQYINTLFPLNIPAIAPLYANADTSRRGEVYYRESNREQDLTKALSTLQRLFPNLDNDYQPLGIFVVTWDNVGMFGDNTGDKVNTFQLAITTDGEASFVEFLYLEGGIQWIKAPNFNPNDSLPPIRAQAGIISPNGELFVLKGSGTDHIINLDKSTNGDKAGHYAYKIAFRPVQVETEIVEEPHISVSNKGDTQATTCAEGGYLSCHGDANCEDRQNGVCCVCKSHYIGNGVSCLGKNTPIRLSGPVNIRLNNERLENLTFEGYVVVKDGRVYTAVDSLPSHLGAAMQFLKPLETIPGWLFAVTPNDTLKNGFDLTGAVFNHTASLTFSPNHIVQIKQKYKGPDAFDQIKLEIDISGRITDHPAEIGLKQSEYDEMFTKTAPGEYRSSSTHKYKLSNGGTVEIPVEQTIQFDENCLSQEHVYPQRLISNRNYLTYKDTILRLAAFHKLGSEPIFEDPCIEGRAQCVANSTCLVKGDSFKCVCNSGFQSEYYGDGQEQLGCVDINECQEHTANCHENALCINEIGSFTCACNSGFEGDGTHCEAIVTNVTNDPRQTPNSIICPVPDNLDECYCVDGYEIVNYGDDDLQCVDIDECARSSQLCSSYAECSNFEGGFECRCMEGFHGDGRDCEPAGCEAIACPSGSVCEDRYGSPQCVCPPGFEGSPPSCFQISTQSPPEKSEDDRLLDDCSTDSDCPQFARCSNNYQLRRRACACLDGYSENSDGSCSPPATNPPSRRLTDRGRSFKTCHNGRCWCPPGFNDEGQYCVRDTEDGQRFPDHKLYDTPTPPLPYDSYKPPALSYDPYEIPPPDKYASTEPSVISEEHLNSCNVAKNCHEHASCIPAANLDGGYRCMCKPGFEGDGYECAESELSCSETDICHPKAICVKDDLTMKSVCVCGSGYGGDGFTCYPSGECTDDSDCGDYGVCEYNEEEERHECGCQRGYGKLDGVCALFREPEGTCSNCDPNADCIDNNGVEDCSCREGYQGDGFNCSLMSQGCDALENCDPNAQCLYKIESEGYRCTCNQGYEGDGLSCNEIATCRQDPYLCNENARCLYLDNKFVCKCNEGFFGNGTYCKEAAKQNDEFLIITKGGSVLRVPFVPSKDDPGVPINIQGSQVAVGITYDCVEGKVYWSDVTGYIKRANYDGSEYEDFLETKGESPEGLALDWINRQIYWTDSSTDKISTANLDTKKVDVIVNDTLKNPRGIAVHPYRKKIYWSDWYREAPKIEEANLDGSRRRIIVRGNPGDLPNALAIDWDREELCWANAGNKTIDCMHLNSRSPVSVVKKATFPFGLAINSAKYFWSDWNTSKIMYAPKSGSPISKIEVLLGGNDKPYGLVAVKACPS